MKVCAAELTAENSQSQPVGIRQDQCLGQREGSVPGAERGVSAWGNKALSYCVPASVAVPIAECRVASAVK